MRRVSYWFARLALNGLAVTTFYLLTSLINVAFSWRLYWCAFAVYVLLSLGDALMKYYWPERFGTQAGEMNG